MINMGQPFDIRGLRKIENNKYNILLSRIGLSFFVAYIHSELFCSSSEKDALEAPYKKRSYQRKVKNIGKFNKKCTRIVLKYASNYTNKQRLKNAMKLNLDQIHNYAQESLKKIVV